MSDVIKTYGGIPWQSSKDALKLIQASSQCSENAAAKALKAWVNNNRVKARNVDTGDILVGRMKAPVSQVLVSWLIDGVDLLDFFEIDAADLRTVLSSSSAPGSGHRCGAPDGYDWSSVEIVLVEACKYWNGVPRRDHPDKEWRSQAAAIKAVREKMQKEWANGGPADSTLKLRVGAILKSIAAQSANN